MNRYLEISSIGSACGEMSFEPVERTLLYTWARHAPNDCKKFLIENGYLIIDNNSLDLLKDHTELFHKKAKNISIDNTTVQDFKTLLKETEQEFTELRKHQHIETSEEELKEFKKTGEKILNTTFGKNSEDTIVKSVKAKSGNDKMYYYYIDVNHCIGGKHDATINDTVLEIKTRTKEANVRKNKYDLYQLYGYLLAMKASEGKIIQQFNGKIYRSDVENDKEYGIIKYLDHKNKIDVMMYGLKTFFARLDLIIDNKSMSLDELSDAKLVKPLAIISNAKYVNINHKYSKLFNFI